MHASVCVCTFDKLIERSQTPQTCDNNPVRSRCEENPETIMMIIVI